MSDAKALVEVKPLTTDRIADADALFTAEGEARGCYCTWYIIPVTQYHAGGAEGNRKIFVDLVESSATPIGLLAYLDGQVVGWCAAGPRSRFVRALRVPSFKGRDPQEDDSVWFVPCFYIRKGIRRQGVALALLEGAVDLASRAGAPAIEGFPFARGAKIGKEAAVAVETLFESCGFQVTRRPSSTRVVMRRTLVEGR